MPQNQIEKRRTYITRKRKKQMTGKNLAVIGEAAKGKLKPWCRKIRYCLYQRQQ